MSRGRTGGENITLFQLQLTSAQVSPATFAHFAHTLMGVAEAAGGRVCAVLEGGYFPLSLAEGAALTLRLEAFTMSYNAMHIHLRTILGDPCPLIPTTITETPNDQMRFLKTT